MKTQEYINAFENKKVLVIGDLVLDEYWYGTIERLSREAPVLILDYENALPSLGGGANAAHNIASLGGQAIPVSVIGSDESGKKMLNIFKEKDIATQGLIVDNDEITPTKIRVMAGCVHTAKQQVLRIDKSSKRFFNDGLKQKIIVQMKKLFFDADAVLVSDYGLGTLSPLVIEEINTFAKEADIPVVVDTRYHMNAYKNATIVAPNDEEATRCLNMDINEDSVKKASMALRDIVASKASLITMGKRGMALYCEKGFIRIPAVGAEEAVDVTGAGDTVCAVLTLALASGADFEIAAKLANSAASEVVMHRGTAVVTREKLKKLAEKYINGKNF